ncbi:MAG: phosphoadenosine phosphosulfate reductase family protein [Candidatus Hodarchaeales archaeon]
MTKNIEWKKRFQYLKEMEKLPLADKICQTKESVSNTLDSHKRPTIAWSGGKDSTVLLKLALEFKPDIDVVWVNTGVEFPECIKFVNKLTKEWNINLHVAKPSMSFWEIIKKYGWPMLGKGGNGTWRSRAAYLERSGKYRLAKATREVQIGAACCRILKKEPADRMLKKVETDCIILGNMVSESRQRFLNWAQRGDYYYAISEKRYKSWPMAFWTDEDVWEYHNKFRLPHSDIYNKGHQRNGCWPCLMDIRFPDSKLKFLRTSHPKLWNHLLKERGLGKRLITLKWILKPEEESRVADEEMDEYVNVLMRSKPCYFDHV